MSNFKSIILAVSQISNYVRFLLADIIITIILSRYFPKFYDCFSDAGYLTFRVAVRRLGVFMEDPMKGLSLSCTDIHV